MSLVLSNYNRTSACTPVYLIFSSLCLGVWTPVKKPCSYGSNKLLCFSSEKLFTMSLFTSIWDGVWYVLSLGFYLVLGVTRF